MKRVIIELDEEFHKQLKIFCFTNGITLKDYITGCVKRDLETKKEQNTVTLASACLLSQLEISASTISMCIVAYFRGKVNF